jgi:type I restriction enzyme M protein
MISLFPLESSRLPLPRLVTELNGQFEESAKLEQAIKANMNGLGYGG